MQIDGVYHSSYITYEPEADPDHAAVCLCTDCQSLSGSAFRTVTRVPGDSFKLLSGKPTIYVKTGDSGTKCVQRFCPRCGLSIYSTFLGD